MTAERKFPDHSYPCPICQQSLHVKETCEIMYECPRGHWFQLELNGDRRELRLLAGATEGNEEGETFLVDKA